MPRVTLRPTIPSDLPHVVGEPLPYRIRAVTAEVDGRIIGMGGIAFPPGGPVIAFAQLAPPTPAPVVPANEQAATEPALAAPDPEARRYPVAFHRAGLMAMKMIREAGAQEVVATADAASTPAVRWLKRLGFTPVHAPQIDGRILFVWRPSGQAGQNDRRVR